MEFSTDRRTVGTHWGKGPVCIEPVGGRIRLPSPGLTCHALSPAGDVLQPVEPHDNEFELRSSYRTLWYLLQRP